MMVSCKELLESWEQPVRKRSAEYIIGLFAADKQKAVQVVEGIMERPMIAIATHLVPFLNDKEKAENVEEVLCGKRKAVCLSEGPLGEAAKLLKTDIDETTRGVVARVMSQASSDVLEPLLKLAVPLLDNKSEWVRLYGLVMIEKVASRTQLSTQVLHLVGRSLNDSHRVNRLRAITILDGQSLPPDILHYVVGRLEDDHDRKVIQAAVDLLLKIPYECPADAFNKLTGLLMSNDPLRYISAVDALFGMKVSDLGAVIPHLTTVNLKYEALAAIKRNPRPDSCKLVFDLVKGERTFDRSNLALNMIEELAVRHDDAIPMMCPVVTLLLGDSDSLVKLVVLRVLPRMPDEYQRREDIQLLVAALCTDDEYHDVADAARRYISRWNAHKIE